MHTIGLLGGMSWESTREYYRMLNEGARDALGGLHSAKLLMHSFDFAEIAKLQHDDKWGDLEAMLTNAAKNMEAGGAEAIVICTNLMHKLASAIEKSINIPLLHIADAVAAAMKTNGQKTAGLLGAKFTMEEPFYANRLKQHGIKTIIPDDADRQIVHDAIYNELCQGKITNATRKQFLKIINRLKDQGAEGVILGCTEIPLLIKQQDTNVTLYDTTELHAQYILDWMLKDTQKQAA